MNKEKKENMKQKNNFFPKTEEEILNFWDKSKIFKKSVERKAPKGDYVFYDGPPFATGTPHYGHIAGSLIKDAIPRYWTMRGFRVERKWGWDCHGLPIENIVEKEMGSKNKKDIEKIGVDKFNEQCRSKVLMYVDEWKKTIRRLGRWADMENCYKTMDLDFMESVWWVFKQLYDKGLIYEGYRSMHICPRCETTLSQSEVAEGYRDIKDLSATVKFRIEAGQKIGSFITDDNTYILAWTTTPWTLLGNVALAVGENIKYAMVKIESDFYILAKDRIEETLEGKEYEFVADIKGEDLVGLKYEPVFDYLKKLRDDDMETRVLKQKGKNLIPNMAINRNSYSKDEFEKKNEERDKGNEVKYKFDKKSYHIYEADFVNTDEGTGVVHIAPAFGDDDMKLANEKDLPFVQHVKMDGTFEEDVIYQNDYLSNVLTAQKNPWQGVSVKPLGDHQKTDIEIIKYLAHKNLLFAKKKYEHSYPHCWRCDSPLLNYATSSWFVNILKIKERMLELAEDINWSPEHIKKGRWGKWLEGARDWSISRQRFWASAIPIWRCEKCNEIKVIGSIKELEKLSGQKVDDLHKHIVDKINFKCEKCGGEMKRVPDVLDCWFESGSMPYAQAHYPFKNREKFEKNFPAEFIGEGADQTRCWFYYLHAIAAGIKDSAAFKNVIVNGIVLAEDGAKMAKKLQNYPKPDFLFEKYSADALRYYLLSSSVMLADTLCFAEQGVQEAMRKNVMLLWNIVKFYELFAFQISDVGCRKSDNILDRWILARLNKLIAEVTENMNNYNLPKATRPIENFISDFSTWYIRRSRDRFKNENDQDKDFALQTTRFVLLQLSKIMAPFMPFIAEQVWQRISGNNFQDENRSVHLESWIEGEKVDDEILEKMKAVRKIVELGLAERDKAGIKVRQPLNKFSIFNFQFSDNKYDELIKEELNVKKIEFKKGDGDLNVKLDTIITPELKQEGIKREMVRLINGMRKNLGLTIQDRILVYWESASNEIKSSLEKYKNEIAKEVLADKILQGAYGKIVKKSLKVNDYDVVIGIAKNADEKILKNIQDINEDELQKIIASGNVEIIDTREIKECKIISFKNSKNIPLAEIRERINEIDWNKNVVFSCKVGARSRMAAILIAEQTGNKIKNLKDGITGYYKKGDKSDLEFSEIGDYFA
ncbi:MAG: isoleucine--tRNA ligase [Patescibacteria group bacterium]|nr:isoleucine--tRNA ligase [Patescibacteria group bacterium]